MTIAALIHSAARRDLAAATRLCRHGRQHRSMPTSTPRLDAVEVVGIFGPGEPTRKPRRVLKTAVRATVPRVRIPALPPFFQWVTAVLCGCWGDLPGKTRLFCAGNRVELRDGSVQMFGHQMAVPHGHGDGSMAENRLERREVSGLHEEL